MAKTLAQILAGEDMEGGELFCDDVYNNLKNHWRVGEPGTPQPGMIWSDAANEKLFHRQAGAWMEIIQADNFYISTLAAGGFALRIDAYQDNTTGLTGLLRGAYIQASNGDEIATGTIRALELKARTARPGEVGNDVAVLEGLSISADAKVYDITNVMRGAEVALDGEAGSTVDKAVGVRIAQNFQADIANLCYGLEFYWDSFEWEADIALASGGLIGGKNGHLKIASAGNVELASAAIGDDVRGLSSIYILSAGKSDGIALYAEGHIGAGVNTDGPTYGGGIWLNIDNGAVLGADVRALDIGIYESGATCGGRNAYGLAIHMDFDDASPPAGIYPFRINCNDTAGHATPSALIFAPNEKAIGLITGDAGTADDAYLKIVMQNGDVYRIPLVKE